MFARKKEKKEQLKTIYLTNIYTELMMRLAMFSVLYRVVSILNRPKRQILLSFLFYKRGSQAGEKLNNVPRVIQQVSGRGGVGTKVVGFTPSLTSTLCSSSYEFAGKRSPGRAQWGRDSPSR